MQIILVPTDFSKNAYCALHYATQLFKKEECNFIIMHSFENQVSTRTSRIDIGKTEAIVDELYETYENKCTEVKHRIILDANNPKHNFTTVVTSWALYRAINRMIYKENVHFVVMGSKGITAASDILMGSNTLSMIAKIKQAALLIIPKELDFTPIRNVGFATGYKRSYSKQELQPLLSISSINNASIRVIHIHHKEKLTDAQRANFHLLFELLGSNNPESYWLSDDSENYDIITSYLEKQQTDLVAMIYYKHSVIARLFREATVKNVAKQLLIPFLILPALD